MTLTKRTKRLMPVLFAGHGSPLNAIEDNEFSRGWKDIANKIPKPKAILCISAHWLTEGTAVTAMAKPKTIHDFYGFPNELYSVHYNAKGSLKLAKEIQKLVKTAAVELDYEWGLDHGAWSVIKQMYPKADIPVVQLSLDYNLPFEKTVKVGKELSELRKKGVLIIGSGNLIHNLMAIDMNAESYDWAIQFDNFVKNNLINKDINALINYTDNKYSRLAHPTNDHYLPLLYVIGASLNEDPEFFNDKIVFGSVGMRCVIYGV